VCKHHGGNIKVRKIERGAETKIRGLCVCFCTAFFSARVLEARALRKSEGPPAVPPPGHLPRRPCALHQGHRLRVSSGRPAAKMHASLDAAGGGHRAPSSELDHPAASPCAGANPSRCAPRYCPSICVCRGVHTHTRTKCQGRLH